MFLTAVRRRSWNSRSGTPATWQAVAQAFRKSPTRPTLGTLEVPGVDAGQKGTFFDYAVGEALQDVVDVRDEAACMGVLRTCHGAATDALVDDARRAVVSLGPLVKDYLEQTGAGDSPGVIQALALWQRGHFKLSPEQPASA
jgi:hypothetical protein